MLSNVPSLPDHFLPRSAELAALKEALLGAGGQGKVIAITGVTRKVGLQGMGGIGKSVLAAALARDGDVQRAFPDGVLWVTLGQEPEQVLVQRQAQLARELGDDAPAFTNAQQGRARLSELLAHKACLLVLDDVWQTEHAQAFDALGPRGHLLITTRDAGVITALGAVEHCLDVLDDEQAMTLLSKWARQPVETLPPEAREVAQECGKLPLALALSAAQVYDGTPWNDLLEALRQADLEFLDHPHGSVMKSLQISVDALSAEQARRYLELAVFPEDETVPEAAVLTLWLYASDLKERHARKLLTTLARKALLRLEGQAPQRRVSLHDLQHDYARNKVNEPSSQTTRESGVARREHLSQLRQILVDHFDEEELLTLCFDLGVDFDSLPAKGKAHKARELIKYLENRDRIPELVKIGMRLRTDVTWKLPGPPPGGLPALHERLLKAYAARCPRGWPSGPDDGYFFPYLAHHLAQAGREDELRALLFDFDWLQARLEATDANALLADYDLALAQEGEPRDDLRLVQGAIRLSTHVLAQDKTQLAGQLLGRLLSFERPRIQSLLARARDYKAAPWLRPLTPSLTPPGGPLVRTLTGHTDLVHSVAVTPDGRYAVSASRDHSLKVWDLESGDEVRTLTDHTGPVGAMAMTPDGRRVVSASDDHSLKVWDLESGEELRTLLGHTDMVTALAVTPDGRRAVSASYDCLKVWELESGDEVYIRMSCIVNRVFAVAVMPDGRHVVLGTDNGNLGVCNPESDEIFLPTTMAHTEWVNAVAVTPDGRYAVSASRDHSLKVWDLESKEELRTLLGHTDSVWAVTVTPDGQRVVSASSDNSLKVWDLESGDEVCTLTGHTSDVCDVAVTPDGQHAVSASSDATLKVWDVESGEEVRTLMGHTSAVIAVAVTPDGRRAVSASGDRSLKVWDLASGEDVYTLTGHTDVVWAVAVMPDGRRAVSASQDHSLKVWDLESGEEVYTLTGHISGVYAVAVIPDGQHAVSASWHGSPKVWDLESGEEVYTLTGYTDSFNAVAVTPDGRRAVSASRQQPQSLGPGKRG